MVPKIFFILLFFSFSGAVAASGQFGAYWLPDIGVPGPDGLVWDGGCVRPLRVTGDKVYFRSLIPGFREPQEFSFPKRQLVRDPRDTKLWHLYLFEEYRTLWEGIAMAAATWEFPDVTRKILNDMVRQGIVAPKEFKKLSSERITKMLVRYTLLKSELLYPISGGKEKTGMLKFAAVPGGRFFGMLSGMEDIRVFSSGKLLANGKEYRCALGAGGIGKEREGDRKTPLGIFPLREVFWRKDRIPELETRVPHRPLSPEDGWCDDTASEKYNRHVTLPFSGSHEKLWREDHVYDIVGILGYNDAPAVSGKGSCIFMHVAREGYTPTDGCVALSKEDFLEILKTLPEKPMVGIYE